MSVTRATTSREIAERTCAAIQRRGDVTRLAAGDTITFDVTLPDVADVTVTTAVAYGSPMLAGSGWACWIARHLGVRATAPRITGDRNAWQRDATDAIRRLREDLG